MFENRYSRIESIPEIGKSGIRKLQKGKIFILGCGALGSLSAMYLAGSGVGKITLADFDNIEISNLQRQLFFSENNLGKPKGEILRERMNNINSEVKVTLLPELITEAKAREYFPRYDFIIDGSDNPSTKYMSSRVCEDLGIPYCIGGVREFSGQVMSWEPGKINYSEIFGEQIPCSGFTPCSSGGIIGPAAGVAASIQASEAIKFLTGAGELLTNRLLIFDLAKPSMSVLDL